jgi:peptidoglycan/xylan/chitin deacetylase (PgdA/CDA1 family)
MTPDRWPLVLMYHGIIPRQPDRENVDLGVVYADQFERHLGALRRRFTVLHPEEFAELARSGRSLPRRSVLVTLDDGFQNVLDHALPAARAHGVVPLAFISTGHLSGQRWLWFSRLAASRVLGGPDLLGLVGRLSRLPLSAIETEVSAAGAPTRDQATPLARLLFDGADAGLLAEAAGQGSVVLGGHTVLHPFLSRETRESRRREIADNKRELEALAGRPVRLFAYPSGDFDAEVARDVRDAGYAAAFAIHPAPRGFPEDLRRFQVPRVGIYAAGPLAFRLKCAGIDRVRRRVGLLS